MFSYKPKGKMTDLFLEGKTFSHIPTSLAQGSGAGDGAGRGEEQPCCLGPRLWAVPSVLSPFPVHLKLTDCQNMLRVHSGSVENLTLGCAAMVCKPPYVKGRRVL